MRRPSPRTITEVTGIVLAAIVAVLSVRGTGSTSVSLSAFVGAALILVLAAGDALVASFRGRDGLEVPTRPVRLRSLAAISFIASVGLTHWPLRAAFAMSRTSFDELARRLDAGESVPAPFRIGSFTIRRAELGGNRGAHIPCFWTDLDDAGKTGFILCGDSTPPFNLWSNLPLVDRWQLITED